jgi:hypothetical protein
LNDRRLKFLFRFTTYVVIKRRSIVNTQSSLRTGEKDYATTCCCGLTIPWSALFWGGALVLIGGAGLLHDLGLMAAGWASFLFPILLLGYGLVLLLNVARRGR